MATMIDLVCGVQLDDQQSAITSSYMNRTSFFCSLGCIEQSALLDEQTLAGQGPMGQSPLDPDATES